MSDGIGCRGVFAEPLRPNGFHLFGPVVAVGVPGLQTTPERCLFLQWHWKSGVWGGSVKIATFAQNEALQVSENKTTGKYKDLVELMSKQLGGR